jgi:hypothetical protein
LELGVISLQVCEHCMTTLHTLPEYLCSSHEMAVGDDESKDPTTEVVLLDLDQNLTFLDPRTYLLSLHY